MENVHFYWVGVILPRAKTAMGVGNERLLITIFIDLMQIVRMCRGISSSLLIIMSPAALFDQGWEYSNMY